ncbi:NusG domain II-containing protein [Pseudoflavonifractor phocaeensis]|uniref:NusG domain II-containing protein n=1 Tax=Pseudoflavonifractor phocaeensis TaxID=1870988 RepID=UPI00195D36EC|nr:NusG domain II-containing protein [Pseudoflavonifractor phocaeensis]MBM6925232.1 NusG domain II-containing protein [Pseudoflavonifractor phocaeensis]
MRSPAADRRRPTLWDGLTALLVATAAFLLLAALQSEPGESLTAAVTLDGEILAEYRLEEITQPVTLTLDELSYPLTLLVEGDGVSILHSDCPSQDCVHTGKITQAGQQIICLPNRLIVSLTGTHDLDFDAVTG